MTQPPQEKERETVTAAIAAVRDGDPEPYAQVVAIYQRRIFGLILMMTRDKQAAEDKMQETFIRAYTHLDRYDEQRDFYPWLSTIAVRLAQNWRRQHTPIAEQEDITDIDKSANTLAYLIQDESARRLWEAVASLPRSERTAVFLFYREEMKVADVATTLGVTQGTVKTLLFRGREKLRSMMAEADLFSIEKEEYQQ